MNSYNGFSGEKRMEVHRWLKNEERAGRLVWPTRCEACGQTEGIFDCHHENYDEPLSYVGLCYVCHLMLHCRRHNPEAFRKYRQAIQQGFRFKACHARDFGAIRDILNGKSVPVKATEEREEDFFARILQDRL